jgi:RecJ-like exonuclease
MLKKVENMVKQARIIAGILESANFIRIISHYDCDGISSASIMVKAFIRAGKNFHLSFVNQLDEKKIEEAAKDAKERGMIVMFLDLGSGFLTEIQKHFNDKTTAIICDHHQVKGDIYSKNILHLNPVLYGIEDNISGSGVTYIVARAMSEKNRDLSELAITGAIGDAQIGSIGSDWGLMGLNKEILKDAVAEKKIRVDKGLRLFGRTSRPIHKVLEYSIDPYIPGITGSESASVQFLKEIGIELKENGKWRVLKDLTKEEQKKLATHIIVERIRGNVDNPDWIFGDVYELLDKNGYSDANEFATILNAFGKQGKANLGVALCLNVDWVFSKVNKILEGYRKDIGTAVNWIENNKDCVKETENAYYIIAGNNISEHIISNVASIINRSMLSDKPLFAFANMENGNIKVSARVDDSFVERGLSLMDIVSKAAEECGGYGGGHHGAAGATIPENKIESFIDTVEKKINKLLKQEKKIVEKSEEDKKMEDVKNGRETGEKMEGEGLVRYLST